jgi:hypothetical protein
METLELCLFDFGVTFVVFLLLEKHILLIFLGVVVIVGCCFITETSMRKVESCWILMRLCQA